MADFDFYRERYQGNDITRMYTQFRPVYTKEIYEKLMAFCKEHSKSTDLAVDVCCGPGHQSSVPLTEYFDKVLGVDVSEGQLSFAPKDVPGLSFFLGKGEDLACVANDSVDLITIASSLHWMPVENFYKEVERVLKPGGTFATYTYQYTHITFDNQQLHDYFHHLYNDIFVPHFESETLYHWSTRYRSLPEPFSGWEREDDVQMQYEWSIDYFLGFIKTWTALYTYMENNPTVDLIGQIYTKVCSIFNMPESRSHEGGVIKVTCPTLMLMVHKP